MTVQKIIHVVNRTLEDLEVMDDGIPWTIKPGYKLAPKVENGEPVLEKDPENTSEKRQVMEVVGAGPGGTVALTPLPYFAAERAKRQNPVMGTEDPLNPNDYQTLIAVPEWGEDYSFLQQSEAIERLDRTMLSDEAQTATVVQARGGRRKITKRRKGGKAKTFISVGGEAAARMENPSGLRLE